MLNFRRSASSTKASHVYGSLYLRYDRVKHVFLVFRNTRRLSCAAAAVGNRDEESPSGRIRSADYILVRAGPQTQGSQDSDLHRRWLGPSRPKMRVL